MLACESASNPPPLQPSPPPHTPLPLLHLRPPDPQAQYGTLYTRENVAITATHSHAGVSGHMQYVAYQLTNKGFNQANFEAIRDGILEVRPGRGEEGRGRNTPPSAVRQRRSPTGHLGCEASVCARCASPHDKASA